MATIRDLRDLVNVSRLSYIESDEENDLKYSESTYAFRASLNLNKNFKIPSSSQHSMNDLNNIKLKGIRLNESISPKKTISPTISKTIPTEAKKINKEGFNLINNSSIFRDRDLLLERNSLPSTSLSKKPLPPLNSSKLGLNSRKDFEINEELEEIEDGKYDEEIKLNSDYKTNTGLTKSIEPLQMKIPNNKNKSKLKNNQITEDLNDSSLIASNTKNENGNFDQMLIYIDASVVSDWLNSANRSLRKMHKWHQDQYLNNLTTSLKDVKLLKYESFILFANFWLGGNLSSKFDHKQKRQLIELEYSIINDEVKQAFQVGLESHDIKLADINRLLRAVFKEYPLQLLSFRGSYLIIDYIDILSTNRQDDYKRLLSDVKCRTKNKQHAQWLLSIRSFSLINLCWSIIKFYRKTVEKQIKIQRVPTAKLNNNYGSQNNLAELDGRLTALSNFEDQTQDLNSCSDSSDTSKSSNSSGSSIKQRPKTGLNSQVDDFLSESDQIKYGYYFEAVLKNDFPDVLHYLIITRKIDPYKIDEQGRSLIFLAVINEKPKILNYLIKRWPSIDVNIACNSGNTPLHAAVNKGKIELVNILLQSLTEIKSQEQEENIHNLEFSVMVESRKKKTFTLDVNKINEKCLNSTALHLAVWNDYNEIALRLVQSKANPYLKMNGQSTALDLAMENNNQTLYELLKEYSEAF